MTWKEWLESDYNTGDFLADEVTKIQHVTGGPILLKDNTDPIFVTSAITSGQEYVFGSND